MLGSVNPFLTKKIRFDLNKKLAKEIDGAAGMNSGIFNNPFMIWGRYRKRLFHYELPVSFQFHHMQMDGAHAGKFLANLQKAINELR